LRQHPLLNSFGIGVFEGRRMTIEQRQAELAVGRERLANAEATVLETAVWLRENIRPIKRPTVGSYGMKHVMERATGKYVTNGEFIAAALIAGYTFRRVQPNVLFGMSARDVQRLS
jgi:hypothetical protein